MTAATLTQPTTKMTHDNFYSVRDAIIGNDGLTPSEMLSELHKAFDGVSLSKEVGCDLSRTMNVVSGWAQESNVSMAQIEAQSAPESSL